MNPILKALGILSLTSLIFSSGCGPGKHIVNYDLLNQEQKDSVACNNLKEETFSVCDNGNSYCELIIAVIPDSVYEDSSFHSSLLRDYSDMVNSYSDLFNDFEHIVIRNIKRAGECPLESTEDMNELANDAYEQVADIEMIVEELLANISEIEDIEDYNNNEENETNTEIPCAYNSSSTGTIQFPCYDGQTVHYIIWNMSPAQVKKGTTNSGINVNNLNLSNGTYILQYGPSENNQDNVLKFVK